ncbi:MAG: Flp pilus assembly protein CpaB [Candidatus Acidiferrales bacterium]
MERKRLLLALGVSVPLALLVSLLVLRQLARASGAHAATPSIKILVAAADQPPGKRLVLEDVRQIDWLAERPMQGMFAKPEDCIGRVLISAVQKDEPILASNLAAKNSGAGLAAIIPEGLRAVSVAVNDVVGVAGFVQPGSFVDVLATGAVEGHTTSTVTGTILQNIRVLATGQKVEPDAQGTPQSVAVVTLLVNPEQANILTLASMQGKIQLALRNSEDTREANPQPTELSSIFGGAAPKDVVLPGTRLAQRTAAAAKAPPPFEMEIIRGNKREEVPVPNP